jgi:hypothetical protein
MRMSGDEIEVGIRVIAVLSRFVGNSVIFVDAGSVANGVDIVGGIVTTTIIIKILIKILIMTN